MASCYQEILSRIDDIQQIETFVPYTNMEFEVGFSNKVLYLFETSMQQNCKFELSLSSLIPPTTIGVTINFYQIFDKNIIFLGSVLATEMHIEFQKDFNPGTFVVCISSSRTTYTGVLFGEFISVATFAKIKTQFNIGQRATTEVTRTLRPIGPCELPSFYELISGELPPRTYSYRIWLY